jgi:uncharacterized protein YkwD
MATRNPGLKAGAIIGSIVGVVAIVALFVIVQPSFLSSFSNLKNVVTDSKIEADDKSPDALSGTGNSGSQSDKDLQAVTLKEYSIENKTEVLVQRSAFLGPDDAYAFEFNVPNENVTFLDGTISVEGRDSVQATFLDSFDGLYCENERECAFTVYGSQSGKKAEDIDHNVHLLVDRGDAIQLVVKNSPSAELQIVKVTLLVTYPVVVEKTATPAIVPVTQDDKPVKDQQPVQQANDKDSSSQQPVVVSSDPTLDQLRKYALEKINEDRKKYDLPPVELSDNQAAQIHAEDVLKTKQISHWMTNGEKPYMTYTRYGGTGSVGQNVALSGDEQYSKDCRSGFYLCVRMDPFREIENHEHGMMYDDAASNWGHRDNIIDKRHTHVSIGIAYDDYAFVMVQNFENNYVDFSEPIVTDDGKEEVQLVGQIDPEFELYGILIYYDELPTASTYEKYKTQGYYEMGDMVAGVVPPDGTYYPSVKTIVASNWHERNGSIDIRFDLSAEKDGVYTIILWLQDDKGEQFDATTYSVFVN